MDGEELDAIMDMLKPECRAVLSTCRFTAARTNEALNLAFCCL